MTPHTPIHRTAAALVCVLVGLLLAPGASFAQIPKLPSLTGKSDAKAKDAAPAPVESAEQAVERLRRQLAAMRGEPPPAPEGASPAEKENALEARTALAYIYERQIRAYEELATAREERLRAEAQARDWQRFDKAPPYPIAMVDALRDAADAARTRIAAMEAADLHLEAEQSRNREAVKRAEAAQRVASDAYANAKNDADSALAAWRRDTAALEARRAAGWIALTQLLRNVQTEDLATQRARLRLLERQIATAAGAVRFTEEDVAAARLRAANSAAAIANALASVRKAAESRQRERDAAELALTRAKASADAAPDRVALAQARLAAADAWLDALGDEVEMLRGEITIVEELPRLWAHRLTAASATDADARREAMARIVEAKTGLERWLAFMTGPVSESRIALRDAEARLARSTESGAATVALDREKVAAAVHAVALNERMGDEMSRIASMLTRWIAELKATESSHSLASRLADAWSSTREFARNVWNFELFAVEDTVVVDGRPVTTSHGVTVGKSVGAVLLFVCGYALAAVLLGRLARWGVARGVDERVAASLRRWSLVVIGFVLLLFTLNIARIPLTAFAFLGGTLAIAIGFGTQTIFKNVISGMILLAERSVQIGDLVDVEGITGTVTAVDLRSSTILSFDGTETIVPNSVLLENKFTNWTRTDRRVRRVVRVGVAYGSPVRQVADILEDCAKRHGLVLDEPAPRAIFEDFGDNAQVFALYLWFELKPDSSLLIVLSDLRFMIEKQMREAGIVIAFPQRDVHLDSAGPLRVELVRDGESAPS